MSIRAAARSRWDCSLERACARALARRVRRRVRADGGFVVVLAIVVLLIAMLLGAAMIQQTVSTEGSVRRDASSKQAIQAARAGIEAANLIAIASAKSSWTTTGNSCPTKTGTTITNVAPTGGWCPAVTQQI